MTTQPKLNKERAKRIENTLLVYKREELGETGPVHASELIDLLTDIRHWCDREEYDFAACDHMAHQHYLAELED